jgi:hypothetical protein
MTANQEIHALLIVKLNTQTAKPVNEIFRPDALRNTASRSSRSCRRESQVIPYRADEIRGLLASPVRAAMLTLPMR